LIKDYILNQTSTCTNTLAISSQSFYLLTPPMKMELKVCSERLAHKIQTPGNHPKERIQHSEHSESLKSRTTGFLILKLHIRMFKQILFPQLYIFHHFTPNLPSPHYEKLLNFMFYGLFSEFVF